MKWTGVQDILQEYSAVHLNFSPEIKVFYMLLKRSLSIYV